MDKRIKRAVKQWRKLYQQWLQCDEQDPRYQIITDFYMMARLHAIRLIEQESDE